MKTTAFLLLAGVLVICIVIRFLYEVFLTRRIFAKQPEFKEVWMAVVMFVLWPSWFILCEIDPYSIAIPFYLRWTGFVMFIAGTVFFLWPVVQFRGFVGPDRLVETGIFKRFRHPMYVGFFLWLVGYPLFQESLSMLITAPLWMANVLFWRYHEEKRLVFQYPEYDEYRKRTWW